MRTASRPPSLVVRPFEPRHLDGAARLLAMQHARRRATVPSLPDRFEQPAGAREHIAGLVDDRRASGVVALRDGVVAGYLLATVTQPEPGTIDAVYFPVRSARIAHGGAGTVADGCTEIYRAMYAAAAASWVAQGCLWRDVMLTSTERIVLQAWFSLGFGLESLRGLRRTDQPVSAPNAADLTFRRAALGDAPTVAAFVLGNAVYHAGPPVFLPLMAGAHGIVERHIADELAEPAHAYWLAERAGRPVSMLAFEPVRTAGHLVAPASCVYLSEAFTEPSERGRGVASALLRHCLGWARDSGFTWCAVNWDSPNIEASHFWPGHGFRPIAARVYRLLDERILSAHPPSQ